MFTPLRQEDVKEIVSIQFQHLQDVMRKNGIDLEITPEAVDALASPGYEPDFGARPLKRLLHREILNDLSKRILSGNISREGKILVDYMGGNIVFRQPEEVGAS